MSHSNSKNQQKLFITGKMGSGKGAAALWLETNCHAQRWTRTDLMKRLAHSLTDYVGNPDEYIARLFDNKEERDHVREELISYTLDYKEESGKPRRLYQDVTEICQKYDPYCFEKELDERINLVKGVQFSLIDDVRKLSAFEFFTDQGYKSLRIQADERIRKQRMLDRDGYLPSPETFNHSSEIELDSVDNDYTIVNNSNDPKKLIEDLKKVAIDLDLSPVELNDSDVAVFKEAITASKPE